MGLQTFYIKGKYNMKLPVITLFIKNPMNVYKKPQITFLQWPTPSEKYSFVWSPLKILLDPLWSANILSCYLNSPKPCSNSSHHLYFKSLYYLELCVSVCPIRQYLEASRSIKLMIIKLNSILWFLFRSHISFTF